MYCRELTVEPDRILRFGDPCVIPQLERAQDQAHRCRFLHELAAALVVEEEHTVTNQREGRVGVLFATILLALCEECNPDASNDRADYQALEGVGGAEEAAEVGREDLVRRPEVEVDALSAEQLLIGPDIGRERGRERVGRRLRCRRRR